MEEASRVWTYRASAYLLERGPIVVIFALGVWVLGAMSAGGLRWNENIVDLFPRDDPVVSSFLCLHDRFAPADMLYFDVGPADDADRPSEGELIAVADALYAELAAADCFKRIVYRWEAHELIAAQRWMKDHRASLFTEGDAELLLQRLTYEAIHERMERWRRVLTESPAPFLSRGLYEDPLGINEIFGDKLSALRAEGDTVTLREGRLFSRDGGHILLTALPQFPATDSRRSETLIAFLDQVIGRVARAHAPRSVRIAYFGGHRASLENALQIKRDVKFTVMLSVAAIAALSFVVYRRTHLVLLTFIPAFFGATLAVGIIRWVDPRVSAITLGCGSMLIGISVDYAIHLLYNVDQITLGANVREETARIVGRLFLPITLSASTTLLAFSVLHFSIMPGYRNLGHFGVLGILCAAAFSIIALPVIVCMIPARTARPPICSLSNVVVPLVRFAASRRPLCYLPIILLSAFSLVGLRDLHVEGDIRKLNALKPQTREDFDRIASVFGDVMGATVFAVQGADYEEALQMNEALGALLVQAQNRGQIRAIGTAGALLPSRRAQMENHQRWQAFWTDERRANLQESLLGVCSELRMHHRPLAEFLAELPGPMPFIDEEHLDHGLLDEILRHHLSKTEGEVLMLTRVRLLDAGAFEPIMRDLEEHVPGVIGFNGQFFVRHIVDLIYREVGRLGLITVGVIPVLLLLFLRAPRTVLVMVLPLLVSLLWTFGFLGWLGIRMNMMNGVVIVFIFGLTVDYSIFLTLCMRGCNGSSADDLSHTCGAIAISGLTTMCGMGALVFAGHPALRSIGATALLGIGSGLIAVFTIIPSFGQWSGAGGAGEEVLRRKRKDSSSARLGS